MVTDKQFEQLARLLVGPMTEAKIGFLNKQILDLREWQNKSVLLKDPSMGYLCQWLTSYLGPHMTLHSMQLVSSSYGFEPEIHFSIDGNHYKKRPGQDLWTWPVNRTISEALNKLGLFYYEEDGSIAVSRDAMYQFFGGPNEDAVYNAALKAVESAACLIKDTLHWGFKTDDYIVIDVS